MKQIILGLMACVSAVAYGVADCTQVACQEGQAQLTLCQKKDRDIASKYFYSTVPGIAVGAVSGAMCKFFDKKNPEHIPLHWIVEFFLRHAITNVIDGDLDDEGIEHHAHLMHFCAWVSSWLGYTHV